jgi:hypothetical protein
MMSYIFLLLKMKIATSLTQVIFVNCSNYSIELIFTNSLKISLWYKLCLTPSHLTMRLEGCTLSR